MWPPRMLVTSRMTVHLLGSAKSDINLHLPTGILGGWPTTPLYIPSFKLTVSLPLKINDWLKDEMPFLGAKVTLPETNSSHLKMDGWNTIVSFLDGLFSAAFAVSFREGSPA